MQYKVFFYPRIQSDIKLANDLSMQLEQCKIYKQVSASKICEDISEVCGMFRDAHTEWDVIRYINNSGKLAYNGYIFYIEKIDNNEQK